MNRQAIFWDARAVDYPGACDADALSRMQSRMALAPEQVRPRTGQSVLDVGAGVGAFSFYAADLGANVTALDISPGMLARLKAQSGSRAIEVVCQDWGDLDPDAVGWRGRFDLVAAQMVPSFRSVQDFERFEACSRGWCLFIGWGRMRQDDWLESAFAAHDVPWSTPPGVPQGLALLERIGQRPQPVYIRETWHRRRSAEAAIRDAADHLYVRGVQPHPRRLADLARARAENGIIVDAAQVEIGMLFWSVHSTKDLRPASG